MECAGVVGCFFGFATDEFRRGSVFFFGPCRAPHPEELVWGDGAAER